MPINSTAIRSVEIQTIMFNSDDTIEVTLVTKIDSMVSGTQTIVIPSASVTPVLDSIPVTPTTIRQTLISAIYTYLITNSLVVGTIAV